MITFGLGTRGRPTRGLRGVDLRGLTLRCGEGVSGSGAAVVAFTSFNFCGDIAIAGGITTIGAGAAISSGCIISSTVSTDVGRDASSTERTAFAGT